MARIILITGGTRSGKSDYARSLAEALPGPRAFVATCPVIDEEMRQRVARHREERRQADWDTVEEELDLAAALNDHGRYRVFLVDCLTLWVNNILHEAEQVGRKVNEDEIARRITGVLEAASVVDGTVLFVTNEVGWGIVPETHLSRLYRDLVGRCNRVVAERADKVILVACGLPLVLKSRAGT